MSELRLYTILVGTELADNVCEKKINDPVIFIDSRFVWS